MKYVGKVGVKVVPDTKPFDAAMRRIESQKHDAVVEITGEFRDLIAKHKMVKDLLDGENVEIEIKAKQDELNEARRLIEDLEAEQLDLKVKYDVDRSALDEVSKQLAAQELKASGPRNDVKLAKLREEYDRLAAAAEKSGEAFRKGSQEIGTHLDLAKKSARELQVELVNLGDRRGLKTKAIEEYTTGLNRARRESDRLSESLAGMRAPDTITGELAATRREAELAADRVEALSAAVDKAKRQKKAYKGLQADLKEARIDAEAASKSVAALNKELSGRRRLEIDVDRANNELIRIQHLLDQLNSKDQKVVIDVLLGDAERKLNDALEKKRRLVEDRSVEIKANIDDAEDKIRRLRTELRKTSNEDARATLKLDLDAARRELAQFKIQLRNVDATARLDLDVAAFETKVKRLTEAKEMTVNADLDAAAARIKLATLTRDRFVNLFVRVSGVSQAAAALKGLSGINMLERFRNKLYSVASGLDTTILKMTMFGSAVGTLASTLLAAIPGVVNFAYGLAKIAPAALAVPAIFASLGVGVGVLTAAFRKLSESSVSAAQQFYSTWTGVKDRLDAMKPMIQEAFFTKQTSSALQNLADVVLPQLERGVIRVGKLMGEVFTSGMETLTEALDGGKLDKFFDNMTDMIERSKDGLDGFVRGLTNLALIGSNFFPDMGDWVRDVGTRFGDWASDTEKVTRRIEVAREQFGYLARGSKDFIGVLDALMLATTNTSAGFDGFANAMKSLRTFVEHPAIQVGLRNMFRGASDGVKSIFTKINEVPHLFGAAMTTLGTLLYGLSQIFGDIILGFTTALASPAAFAGLEELMRVLREGVQSIDWVGVGSAIGAIGFAISAMVPYIVEIVNILIGWLPTIFTTIGFVASGLMSVVAALLPIAPAILGIIAAALLMGKIYAIADSIRKGMELVRVAIIASTAAQGGFNLTALANPYTLVIMAIIVAVAALVAAIIYLWNTNDNFRAAVTRIWEQVKDVVSRVMDSIGQSVGEFVAVVGPLFVLAMQWIGDQVAARLTRLSDFWDQHGQTVMAVVGWIVSSVNTILSPITTIIDVMATLGLISKDSASEVEGAMSKMDSSFQRAGTSAETNAARAKNPWQSLGSEVSSSFADVEAAGTASFNALGISAESGFTQVRSCAAEAGAGMSTDWSALLADMQAESDSGMAGIFDSTSLGFGAVASDASAQTSAMSTDVASQFANMQSIASAEMLGLQTNATSHMSGAASGVSSHAGAMSSATAATFATMKSTAIAQSQAMRAGATQAASEMNKKSAAETMAMSNAVVRSTTAMNTASTAQVNSMSASTGSAFTTIVGQSRNSMSQFKGLVVQAATDTMNGFNTGLQQGASRATSTAATIPGSLQGAIGYLGGLLVGHGASLVDGLVSGMMGRLGSALAAARNLASQIASTVAGALRIHSPSRVMRDIGKWIPSGLALGIESNPQVLKKATTKMVNVVTDATSELQDFSVQPFNLTTSVSATVNRPDAVVVDYEVRDAAMTQAGAAVVARSFAKFLAPTIDQELELVGTRTSRGAY